MSTKVCCCAGCWIQCKARQFPVTFSISVLVLNLKDDCHCRKYLGTYPFHSTDAKWMGWSEHRLHNTVLKCDKYTLPLHCRQMLSPVYAHIGLWRLNIPKTIFTEVGTVWWHLMSSKSILRDWRAAFTGNIPCWAMASLVIFVILWKMWYNLLSFLFFPGPQLL